MYGSEWEGGGATLLSTPNQPTVPKSGTQVTLSKRLHVFRLCYLGVQWRSRQLVYGAHKFSLHSLSR